MPSQKLRAIAAAGLFAVTCVTGLMMWKTVEATQAFPEGRALAPRGIASVRASAVQAIPAASDAHTAVISIDEVLVNLPSTQKPRVNTLGLKLELELFDEGGKVLIGKRQAGIRHTIIEATYEQNTEKLSTLGGKLYFKETLVSRLNSFLQDAVIRDIHFSQFLIQ